MPAFEVGARVRVGSSPTTGVETNSNGEVVTLPRIRSPERDKAFEIYKKSGGKIELVKIAEQLGVPEGTIRGWKNKDKWEQQINGTLQKKTERSKRKKGGQPNNKNAVGNKGGSAPEGNINAVKHGAYQTIYAQFLPESEREIYNQMPSDADLEAEIKLLRLKMARLLNRDETFFYDAFGNRHEKELSDEDRDAGILAVSFQLEKLMKTQAQIKRMELDKEEQQERINKLRAETKRITEEKQDNKNTTINVIMGGEVAEYAK